MTAPADPQLPLPLRVLIAAPASPQARGGNRVTALRIAALLRSLGHRVRLRSADDGEPVDLLLALHAQKSSLAVASVAARAPSARIVVVLTGTDLYPRLDPSAAARAALRRADRLVALQPLALEALPAELRAKGRVVVQSATAPPLQPRSAASFDVCVLANLRHVKDPLLPARAAARLPEGSPVRVQHAGAVLDADLEHEARALEGPRYRWLGPLPRRAARVLLASSHLLVVPSRHEGGANVVSEAIAAGLPILATAVPGTLGLLGADHPGLFPSGDVAALAALLDAAAHDPSFAERLAARSRQLQPLVAPARERVEWQRLLDELFGSG